MTSSSSTNVRLRWGAAGHEHEYTIGIPGYDHDNYIPDEYVAKISALLPEEYSVGSRGSRLEINYYLLDEKAPDHSLIQSIVSSAIGLEVDFTDLYPYENYIQNKKQRATQLQEMREKLLAKKAADNA